ncbi:MAG: hypothetical protein NTX91_03600 [candidate division SR1 bacterium]|nr:hypothetical protein [candidate division SR1 bacterium]
MKYTEDKIALIERRINQAIAIAVIISAMGMLLFFMEVLNPDKHHTDVPAKVFFLLWTGGCGMAVLVVIFEAIMGKIIDKEMTGSKKQSKSTKVKKVIAITVTMGAVIMIGSILGAIYEKGIIFPWDHSISSYAFWMGTSMIIAGIIVRIIAKKGSGSTGSFYNIFILHSKQVVHPNFPLRKASKNVD